MTTQRLYNGVRLATRPSPDNVRRLDSGAMPLVLRMMKNGMRVDRGRLASLSRRLLSDMIDIAGQLESIAGRRVNPAAPADIARFIFKDLGLEPKPGHKINKDGSEATGKMDLEAYIPDHVGVKLVFDWKERAKLKSTYCEALQKQARQDRHGAWRVHTQILWTRTTTARYASRTPNLQQIPGRTDLGKEVRRAFIASHGKKLISADFSGIEMRVVAHMAGAVKMIDVFHTLPEKLANGKDNPHADIHTRTAADVYKIPVEAVHKQRHRYPMKRVGFGVVYLISAPGLQKQLNAVDAQDPENPHVWTEEECEQLISDWYSVYPEIKEFQQLQASRARRYGFVWDMFGRTRLIPEVKSALPWISEAGDRMAGNMPVQASAGGFMKLAMGSLTGEMEELRKCGVDVEELMTIHDELIFECEDGAAEDVGRIMQSHMENCAGGDGSLLVPIRSSCDVGDNWGDLK